MSDFTFESENTAGIPLAKLFKAYVIEGDKLFPKVVPHAIKSVEILEGDGAAGSIKKLNCGEGTGGQREYVVQPQRDVVRDVIEKISFETKIVACGDGGSIWKSKGTYYTKGDVVLEEDEVKTAEEKGKEVFKAVEQYVLAHPLIHTYTYIHICIC
ncbi:major strawberry allergen Fra a 1.06-like [Tripterygium wilfordii]|uniref:major strawberry allergen Fra a 1.06-like n=1 Tax=Tripterygium wilfordii TaxID=458696 RepID=UPI0018F7F8B7|nr:major strawberry allergen Fra a 1.06-like [Tripterygium wilfordii]